MGYGSVNVGYPINADDLDFSDELNQHNQDPNAHADIRQALDGTLKATVQVSYNGG